MLTLIIGVIVLIFVLKLLKGTFKLIAALTIIAIVVSQLAPLLYATH